MRKQSKNICKHTTLALFVKAKKFADNQMYDNKEIIT